MNRIYRFALILTVIGGINWGLVGMFNIDLVATLFGPMSPLSRVIYSLVGVSAVFTLVIALKKCDKHKNTDNRVTA